MKSQMLLLQKYLLADAGRIGNASTHRDFETVSARVNTEGESFLTITLPKFAKDLQRALADSRIDPAMFTGFARGRGQLPRFLGGLLEQVFDSGSGLLLDNPSHAAIQAIRQVTMAFGKIERNCSNERVQTAYESYVECERNVADGDRGRSIDDLDAFGRVASLLWSSLNSSLDRRIFDDELRPSHGPGAVADGLKGNTKYTLNEWTERLEKVFPYIQYARASYSEYEWVQNHVTFREPGNERPVKVIHVPKTDETVRIIAEEPSCMMFIQQGLLAMMKEEYRIDENAKAFICFDSQETNQLLAQEGSLSGQLATLDLKEASDRVSNQLVLKLHERFPTLREAVQACRSRSADLGEYGGIIRLSKFASMGSALTFPLEAMVFATLVFLGIERELSRPLSHADIKSLRGKVRVYGDDIVVPVGYVSSVISTLESFGLLVNRNKSFWTGLFRESCGGDFYAGRSVRVARVRREFPESRKDAAELVSLVSLRNQLDELGYEQTVNWLDTKIKKILPVYPCVTKDSPILGRVVPFGLHEVQKMHKDHQRPLARGYVVDSPVPVNSIDGYDALLKVLSKRGTTPFEDPQHLERSGRPSVVRLKLKWMSPV